MIKKLFNVNYLKNAKYFCQNKNQKYIYEHMLGMSLLKKNNEYFNIKDEYKDKLNSTNFENLADLGFEEKELIFYEAKEELKSKDGLFRPIDSFLEIEIPLGSNEKLKNKFSRFSSNTIRVGKILELIDYISGRVGYKHAHLNSDDNIEDSFYVVTACLDGFQNFSLDYNNLQNILIQGYLNYCGNSSMEIQVDVKLKNGELLSSCFLMMVARNKNSKNSYKSLPILTMDTKELMIKKELALLRKNKRIKNAEIYKQNRAPNNEEIQELHNFLKKKNEIDLNEIVKKEILISDTLVEKTEIVHNENKNIHGKMFGGCIMREAYELAYICAFLIGNGETPKMYHIFDTQFYLPVDIGSIIKYQAKVCYSLNNLILVKVTIDTWLKTEHHIFNKRTNELNIAFYIDKKNCNLKPNTYQEGIDYINSKKLLTNYLMIN